MVELGKADSRILAITAAMPEGTGLTGFAAELPGQFFDVGIAEQHAVNFAAGLALCGFKPVCAIYSTFLQRAYDQVYHDVCLQNLPVVFALDRSGIVPDDGPTHQGINDIAFLRHMPNIVLMAPRDEAMLRRMIKAALDCGLPAAVRYPKALGEGTAMDAGLPIEPVPLGRAEILRRGDEGAGLILAYGHMVHPALEAAAALEAEGLRPTVADARFAKPLDEELILRFATPAARIITIEEGVASGGFGSAVRELLDARGRCDVRFEAVGLPIEIYPVGKTDQIKCDFRLDVPGLTARFREFFKR
jgi:1-deoxy-D-xylulose-5-phosphate synthase